MNLTELERKLIAAARREVPSDQVPYAFEKRIMALVKARPEADLSESWAHALWRSAVACLAVMLISGAVSFFSPVPAGNWDGLSEEFENTMLAAVDQETELFQ